MYTTQFLIFVLLANCVFSELTLVSDTLTPFGSWQPWALCPEGTFVVGADVNSTRFHAMSRASSTRYDDVGLISIVLQCQSPPGGAGNKAPSFIYSVVPGVTNFIVNGQSTETRNVDVIYKLPLRDMCTGVAIGFQLMIQPEQVAVDNAGAVNLRLYCSELKRHDSRFLESYGDSKGEWTNELFCRNRQAICGLQTKAEIVDTGDYDNTGINNIRVKCCDLPNPASICQPTDEWQLIQQCNAGISEIDLPCSYTRQVGLSTTKMKDHIEEYDFNENNGYTLSEDPFWLQNGLAETYATRMESSTGFDWSSAGDETFNELNSELIEFTVGSQKVASIYQTVGKCSYFVARTARFKIETDVFTRDGFLVNRTQNVIN